MHHRNCWLLYVESTVVHLAQFSLQMLDHLWSNSTTKQQQQTQPIAGHVGWDKCSTGALLRICWFAGLEIASPHGHGKGQGNEETEQWNYTSHVLV